jgi:hypothetical protein
MLVYRRNFISPLVLSHCIPRVVHRNMPKESYENGQTRSNRSYKAFTGRQEVWVRVWNILLIYVMIIVRTFSLAVLLI